MGYNKKISVDEIVNSMYASVREMTQAEQVWRILIEPTITSNFKSQLTSYGAFFISISRSSFSTVIMGLSRLSDNQKSAVNLKKLLEAIKNNENADKVNCLIESYLEYQSTWDKLIQIRHNVFAHISSNTTEKDAFMRAGLTPNEISDAVKISQKILFKIINILELKNFKKIDNNANFELVNILELLKMQSR